MASRACFALVLLMVAVMVLCGPTEAKVSTNGDNMNLMEKVKHIIVVMEENRSFDHMLGWLKGVNGVFGQTNPVNASNPIDGTVKVSPTAKYVNDCDPDHSTPGTTYKVFGPKADAAHNFTDPTMSGFVEYQKMLGDGANLHYCDVMEGFLPHRIPVMSTLAQEFGVFDAFHASHPGPTWPNRMFFLSGTSMGSTETGAWFKEQAGRLFPQKTFFDEVADAGLTWKNYYNDTPWELFLESIAKHPENTAPMTEFFNDAKEGTFPSYAFINPRMGINVSEGLGSNDQHPDHDVALGEAYLKDIYEAVRASPQWNETLLIITYDEHGGFYDHVPTPLNVPPPGDDTPSYPDPGFKFDRVGIRIPTIAISPWIPKGTVISQPPPQQKPAPNSAYELTSIMATARKLLKGLDPSQSLTKRDAWAATFEHIVDHLDAPRTDCPEHLPAAPAPTPGHLEYEAKKPVNGLQEHALTVHSHLAGQKGFPSHIKKQEDVTGYLRDALHHHRENKRVWKEAKHHHHHGTSQRNGLPTVSMATAGYKSTANTKWIVETFGDDQTPVVKPYVTIATNISTPNGAWMCLDAGVDSNQTITAGMKVAVAPCLISPKPAQNPDRAQHWILGGDLSIRPKLNPELCLSNTFLKNGIGSAVTFEVCDPSRSDLTQNWSVQGYHPGYGMTYSHVISMGVASINIDYHN